MHCPQPIVVRLPLAFARGRLSLAQVLDRATEARVRPPEGAFRLHPRELRFAREILERHTRLWLYRAHQQRFAGDFALVDMSAPRPEGRRLWIVDLKLGADVKLGGGGAGNQLCRAPEAVAALEAQGVVRRPSPVLATGDGRALIGAILR